MSSGCGDVLSLEDLRTAKIHQIFEAEVITGLAAGVAGGANIDFATNPITGQTQKTMPAILRDLGFEPASFDFTTGGILSANDRNKAVYDPSSQTWYSWAGSLPKTVPAGTSPLGDSNWKPQTDPKLRSDLASTTSPTLGSGMVGFDKSQAYPVGSAGYAIRNFVATNGTRNVAREDRASWEPHINDYAGFSTDAGVAGGAAVAQFKALTSASNAEMHGNVLRIPAGSFPSNTSIDLGGTNPNPGKGLSIKGNGITSSYLNMKGSAAATDGVSASSDGVIYSSIEDMGVINAPGHSFNLNTISRSVLRNLQSVYAINDGFYIGNVFMTEVSQLHALAGSSHGINFAPGSTLPGVSTAYTKTTIFLHNSYTRNNAGAGLRVGDAYYCHSTANGMDSNGQQGYRYENKIRSYAVTADGAESNQQSGFAVLGTTATSDIKTLSFRNIYAYGNNRGNTVSPNLLLVQAGSGGQAWASLEASTSIPAGAGSASKDVLVTGDGAHLYLKGDCLLPNGFEATSGGYIHFEQVPVVTSKTVTAATALAVCGLQSTQGKTARYAGKVTVVVSSLHPSDGTNAQKMSVYELLVQKGDSGSAAVKVVSQAGYADFSGTNAASYPIFSWTLNTVTNNLVATPATTVGGQIFWFEITASSQIVASLV